MPLDFPQQDAHNDRAWAWVCSRQRLNGFMLLLLQTSLTDERNLPLIGVGMLALAYVVLRPMLKRKRDPLERAPAQTSMAQQRAVERQMQNLLVDLTEMARQIGAQLDTRAARLEALIREADEKIAQLRGAGAGPGAGGGAGASAVPPHDSSYHGSAAPAAHHETTASAPASIASPHHAEVYALADEGRAPKEIAARLNRPSGEIELILALRTPRG